MAAGKCASLINFGVIGTASILVVYRGSIVQASTVYKDEVVCTIYSTHPYHVREVKRGVCLCMGRICVSVDCSQLAHSALGKPCSVYLVSIGCIPGIPLLHW